MGGYYWWDQLIAPHVDASDGLSGGIFKCPTHHPSFRGNVRVGEQRFRYIRFYHPSYGYNAIGYVTAEIKNPDRKGLGGATTIPDARGNIAWHRPTIEAEVRNPSDLLANRGWIQLTGIREIANDWANLFGIGCVAARAEPYSTNPNVREAERRHRKRLNMVFADGHVEDGKVFKWYLSMKVEDLRRWRTDNEAPME